MAKINSKLNIKWTLLVLVLGFLLFSYRLDFVPVHLNQDELEFSLNALSVARTGYGANGTYMPFYFWHLDSLWATPVIVYLASAFLKFLPISEAIIRLPSVFVGVFSIYLLAVLVRRMFKSNKLALLAGVLLATTPVFFIHSRLLLDNLYPVPFVLLWLILTYRYVDTKKSKYLLWAGLALGMGIHSYHAAKVMFPLYVLLTIWVVGVRKINKYKGMIIGFLIPIILFIPWLQKYPDTLLNQVSYIGAIDKSVETSRGLLGVFNVGRLQSFATNYVTYFSPDILFTKGDRSLIHSTGEVGAFLFPVVFLLAFGIIEVAYRDRSRFSKLVLLGLLTYPVAPAIVNDPQRISRGLVVIPFLILLSVYGVRFLLRFKRKEFNHLLLGLLIFGALQYFGFLTDYFGEYRVRSYGWFNNNIGGAMESVNNSTQIRSVKTIYLDGHTPFIDRYFSFYKEKVGLEIDQPVILFDYTTEEFSEFPEGSIVAVRYDHLASGAPDMIGEFEKIEIIREPNGNETFYVYYNGGATMKK